MYKIGMSACCGEVINENMFMEYSKAGVDSMEISTALENYENLNYKELLKFSEKYGVELWSYHLPFASVDLIDLSSLNSELRKKNIAYHSELIKKASDIGIKRFVVHPSSEPVKDDSRAEQIKYSMDSLNELAEVAANNGSIIAVENLPRTCLGNSSANMEKLLSANDKLRVCFDTNHLLNEELTEFIKNVGDKIVTLHISDYDFVNERHWLPGEGKINWNDVLNGLINVGYDGVWMYEINFKCPKTIIRNRDLCCDDFIRNAHEIFEGKAPTVFSTKKENLGMWE